MENLNIKNTKYNRLREEKAAAYLNNSLDRGAEGKAFEMAVTSLLLPYSKIVDIQPSGKADIRFNLDGETIHAEIKSESGEICKFFRGLAQKDKKDLTLNDLLQGQKRSHIIYSIDGTLENARLLKTEQFFKILLEYPGRPSSMVNWIDSKAKRKKEEQGRLMVSVNPTNAAKRREYLAEAIKDLGISLAELVKLRK